MSNLVSDLMRGGKQKHEAEKFAREQTMHHFRVSIVAKRTLP